MCGILWIRGITETLTSWNISLCYINPLSLSPHPNCLFSGVACVSGTPNQHCCPDSFLNYLKSFRICGDPANKIKNIFYHEVFHYCLLDRHLDEDIDTLKKSHQLTVFNSQSTIQVGGRWNRSKGRVERPFLGVIAGLVVNGARILELAAAKDGKVATRGDVQLLPAGSLLDRAPPLQRMQQTPASGFPGVMDDLIFSGAGSGCAGDDEDEECTPIYESGSDDIITPVYVAPTRLPTTLRPKHKENIQERPTCDDEEDCEEGSGDSRTTEEIFVTSATDISSVTYTTPREYSTSHISTQTTSPSSTTLGRDVVTVSVQYNVSTTDLETSHSSSVVTHRSTTVTTQTTTTEMTEPPPPPPPPVYPPMPTPPKNNNNKRITSEAAENAALIIGIIAAALIAIVLIILIILKFKNRPETSYKVDETKTFCQDPNAALLGAAGSGQPFNGSLKNGANGSKSSKKRELIDIKEWYV
ncbi:Neurexin-2-beta [Trachymyrmex septentrionalis]|uniref:Neurexin-2-beta n=1 Tax=Trachymyrmex septentrionalis TaxID=34720 RepID=A0A195F949_9HYME|nr:Neurexin-2-beta [Trachymyrmex septentrionalis]